jgi:hypothetical protein
MIITVDRNLRHNLPLVVIRVQQHGQCALSMSVNYGVFSFWQLFFPSKNGNPPSQGTIISNAILTPTLQGKRLKMLSSR